MQGGADAGQSADTMMSTRRQFLRVSLSTAALSALPRATAALPPRDMASFFLVGDTHYVAEEKTPGKMKQLSADYNSRLVGWLNMLPGTAIPEMSGGGTVPEPHGVVHAGDMIDSGDKGKAKQKMMETETAAWTKDWGLNGGDGKLRWAVREIHGNHDGPQGDTSNNAYVALSNYHAEQTTRLGQAIHRWQGR